MAALGVEEVHYFVLDRQGIARLCFGFGLAALLVTLGSLGYVFLLAARHPSMPATELWSLCVRLGVRNLFVTGPLFLVEIVVATLLTLVDPPLLLLGVPAVFLYSMRLTAQFGLRRAASGTLI